MDELVEQDSERKYPCTDCEYKANRPDHLRRHKLKTHSDHFGHENKPSVNTEIKNKMDTSDSESFKSGNKLFKYLTKQHYSCDECDFKAGRVDSLKRHKNKVHNADKSDTYQSTKTLKCEYCDFTFSRGDNLKCHVAKKHH